MGNYFTRPCEIIRLNYILTVHGVYICKCTYYSVFGFTVQNGFIQEIRLTKNLYIIKCRKFPLFSFERQNTDRYLLMSRFDISNSILINCKSIIKYILQRI